MNLSPQRYESGSLLMSHNKNSLKMLLLSPFSDEKLRHREVKQITQSHTADKRQTWNLEPKPGFPSCDVSDYSPPPTINQLVLITS